jgi:pilus assembly protein Flp/PilA
MLHNFLEILRDEEGQGLVEYALILLLVALVVILALKSVGNQIGVVSDNAAKSLGG